MTIVDCSREFRITRWTIRCMASFRKNKVPQTLHSNFFEYLENWSILDENVSSLTLLKVTSLFIKIFVILTRFFLQSNPTFLFLSEKPFPTNLSARINLNRIFILTDQTFLIMTLFFLSVSLFLKWLFYLRQVF